MCGACDGPGMHAALAAATASAGALRKSRFKIEGMDCASCAAKIDTAVRRLVGVREASVSVSGGTLAVTHEASLEVAAIRDRVIALGYRAEEIGAGKMGADAASDAPPAHGAHRHDHSHDHDHHDGHRHTVEDPQTTAVAASAPGATHAHFDDPGVEGVSWWRTRKALLTWACGGALLAAYGLGYLMPDYAPVLFVLALAVGLVPSLGALSLQHDMAVLSRSKC